MQMTRPTGASLRHLGFAWFAWYQGHCSVPVQICTYHLWYDFICWILCDYLMVKCSLNKKNLSTNFFSEALWLASQDWRNDVLVEVEGVRIFWGEYQHEKVGGILAWKRGGQCLFQQGVSHWPLFPLLFKVLITNHSNLDHFNNIFGIFWATFCFV